MNPQKNLRLMMLFLVLTAIVLAYDHLPKMKAAVSQLADLPTGLNAVSKAGLAMSKAVIQPLAAIPVTNTNDSGAGSLRTAIAAAQDGDTVDASGITGTITLQSAIVIGKSISINGPAAGTLTVSGNNSVRVFDITAAAGSTVSMSRLTIANGRSTELVASTGGAGDFVRAYQHLRRREDTDRHLQRRRQFRWQQHNRQSSGQ